MKKTLLIAALASLTMASAQATLFNFTLDLNGLNEVPTTPSPGIGIGTATWDSDTSVLTMSGTFTGLLAPTSAAHIHTGVAGANGPVLVGITFSNFATSGTFSYSGTAVDTAGEINALFAGGLYVNIHTLEFPGGEIRGQLTPVPEPETYAMIAGAGLVGFGVFRRFRR
jgi:hypothetical protein